MKFEAIVKYLFGDEIDARLLETGAARKRVRRLMDSKELKATKRARGLYLVDMESLELVRRTTAQAQKI